jgi:transcriptional regulator with XRE-family HTH domain
MSELKLRQSAKLREIAAALEADGFIGLDAQAKALGLSRSTAWTILRGSHKHSGLSATTLNRMLASPLLGARARAKILEYIAEKRAGHYGLSKLNLRRFDQRLEACPPSPLALRG